MADGVGKRFLLHHKRATSLKERLLLHRQSSSEAFWALREVDLEIGAGQTVGLIGPGPCPHPSSVAGSRPPASRLS